MNTSTVFPTTNSNVARDARKSSLNPTQNVLQKSLGSIDYQQQKMVGKSSSLNRHPSGIRSRDKLPEIGLSMKINLYKKRVEQNILS